MTGLANILSVSYFCVLIQIILGNGQTLLCSGPGGWDSLGDAVVTPEQILTDLFFWTSFWRFLLVAVMIRVSRFDFQTANGCKPLVFEESPGALPGC